MLLWIILSLLTGGVVLLLLKKDVSKELTPLDDRRADVNVYVDQLKQIEADLSQGTLSEKEALAARAEVARRLLSKARDENSYLLQTGPPQKRRSSSLLIVLLSVPLFSLGLYAFLGSPELPSLPHASREVPSPSLSQVDDLIQKVETRLKEAPEDGTGWDVIAPIYLRIGNYAKAYEAYKNAARLLGENPKRLAGLIQSDILLKDGAVSSEAKAFCERLLQLEPDRVDARLWLSLAKEQAGQLEEALQEYKTLLKTQSSNKDLSALITERIDAIEKRKGGQTLSSPPPQTDPLPSEGAQNQQDMIESMVARLAKRLESDGKDPEGWTKLLRSYMVLGQREKALSSLEEARRVLSDDPQGLSVINAEASKLGLDQLNSDQEEKTNR